MVIEELNTLAELVRDETAIFVEPIPTSFVYHPKLNNLIGLYLFCKGKNYIIPLDLEDCINLEAKEVMELLKKVPNVYTFDKKESLYYLQLPKLKDIKVFYKKELKSSSKSSFINWMYSKDSKEVIINKFIPTLKLLEYYKEKNENLVKNIYQYEDTKESEFFNKIISPTFFIIEQEGLSIFYQEFIEMFKPVYPSFSIKNNITYTYYNLFNTTSRPTNSFNNVNYAAIPKKEEYRKCFKPKNDVFIELDFDGYHLRLIADLVDFPLTNEAAHSQLAKKYFNKLEITNDEYKKAKQINFQAIYGIVPNELVDFPLFKKIEQYTINLWNKLNEEGFVADPISGKVFKKDELLDMNPKKLFNYMIQALETSRNSVILKDLVYFLRNKKSKVVLYTYDSILIDFNKEDGKESLNEIQKILNNNDKYPVKVKYSKNLVF